MLVAAPRSEAVRVFHDFGTPDYTLHAATAISRDGSVAAGTTYTLVIPGSDGGGDSQAFRWTPDEGIVPLGFLLAASHRGVARDEARRRE